ncbi:MAG: CDP-alcohol phosphatidyltransferase family protein [Dissulfuribacterales bacterium]
MSVYVYIFRESPVRLWGLSLRQRLERVLKKAGITGFTDDIFSIPSQSRVLLIRGDYLYDERVISSLLDTRDVLLLAGAEGDQVAAAAHIPACNAPQILELMTKPGPGLSVEIPVPGIRTKTPETLTFSVNKKLRKSDPPFVLPVTSSNYHELEQHLFNSSYKGITDLITKWAWPLPARWGTRICASYGIRPNHVTTVSLVLVILAAVFFRHGLFGWGLLAGWIMTFLDTVDGKLARVTVTSSRFGHLFDHLIDLIHPPVWYVVWGLGLGVSHIYKPWLSLNLILWLIIGGYIIGRLAELMFTACLDSFGIFCWRPFDSYFRLITARRNPNLILLSAGAATGRPDLGLLAVAFWTVASSIILVMRLVMAGFIRITSGPLCSWLPDIDKGKYNGTTAKKIFTSKRTICQGNRNE